MPTVNYDLENFNRCLCGGCPVNRNSDCTHQREEALGPVFEAIESGGPLPDPNAMPGLYCAVGKSACGDLSEEYSCLCPGCSIFLRQELGTTHYCTRGSAEEVG